MHIINSKTKSLANYTHRVSPLRPQPVCIHPASSKAAIPATAAAAAAIAPQRTAAELSVYGTTKCRLSRGQNVHQPSTALRTRLALDNSVVLGTFSSLNATSVVTGTCVPNPSNKLRSTDLVYCTSNDRRKTNTMQLPYRHSTLCLRKKRHRFYFYDNFVRCRPIQLILDTIIGQSIYNVPALTFLLETEILSIVEYQLKCCSVADNAAPDCHITGLEQRVVNKAINEWHGRLHACVRADGQHFEHLP